MSHNTWIHRVVRVGVRPLARTDLTPNQVTGARLVTGLAAAAMLAVGGKALVAIGAGALLLSMLLDRADGELARQTGKFSPGGHRFDLFADALCTSLIFIAIGIGLRDDNMLGYWAIPMGAVAGIAVVFNLWMVMTVEELKGARAAELGSRWGFDPDDATFLIPVFLWMGWEVGVIVLAFLFAPLFAFLAAFHFVRAHRLLQGKPVERRVFRPIDPPRS